MTRFEPTIPFGEPELMRASEYRRYLDDLEQQAEGMSARISSLSPSVRADLYRFEADGGASEVLEVMAACVRHAQRLTVHLQFGERVLPLTVFPQESLVHCLVPISQLLGPALTSLRVLHVEPAVLCPPGDPQVELVGEERLHTALAPLLWELAMRGSRNELLPEIAGPAVYRVTPGRDWTALPAADIALSTIRRLERESLNLHDLSEHPGLDRERASRLLNALYLQAALIVSRSHPDAIGEGWFRG